MPTRRRRQRQKPSRAARRDPFRAATLAFGVAYERAVMDWFEGLPEAIRDPTIEPPADA